MRKSRSLSGMQLLGILDLTKVLQHFSMLSNRELVSIKGKGSAARRDIGGVVGPSICDIAIVPVDRFEFF